MFRVRSQGSVKGLGFSLRFHFLFRVWGCWAWGLGFRLFGVSEDFYKVGAFSKVCCLEVFKEWFLCWYPRKTAGSGFRVQTVTGPPPMATYTCHMEVSKKCGKKNPRTIILMMAPPKETPKLQSKLLASA